MATFIGALHLAGALAAAFTKVMLHGDGSLFVYALTLGEAWELKWSAIAARSTIYVVTVLPTAALSDLFSLGPMQTAALNGFIFYGVPGLLFAGAASLVWNRSPEALYYLVLQFIGGYAIGYGFPSEILLAPGFLWLALFLLYRQRKPSAVFFLVYTALIFCHELALPAALVVACYAIWLVRGARSPQPAVRLAPAVALLALPVVALFAVQFMGGSAGSKSNLVFILDPRRVLDNPTLWIVLALLPAIYLGSRNLSAMRGGNGFLVAAILGGLTCALAHLLLPELNFAAGRYDGRTLIAGSMFVLSAIFFHARIVRETENAGPRSGLRTMGGPPAGLVGGTMPLAGAATGIMLVSSTLFLADWGLATQGLYRIVEPTRASGGTQFVTCESAFQAMTPEQMGANRRMGFDWVYPYRSFILADGRSPNRVVIGHGDYNAFCEQASALDLGPGPYPSEAFDDWVRYSCEYEAPPEIDTMSKRLRRRLRAFLGDIA